MHETGWFDFMNPGSMQAYLDYQHHGGEGARGNQMLIAGVVGHGTGVPVSKNGTMVGCKAGDLVFAPEACHRRPTEDIMHWFRHHAGLDPSPPAWPRVYFFTVGDVTNATAPGNSWEGADSWPPPGSSTMLLYTTATNRLSPSASTSDTSSEYLYDPSDPAPTVGGRNLFPEAGGVGPMDQRGVEARADVVSFSMEIDAPMQIAGEVTLRLVLRISAVDTSIVAHLSDVYPDGRSMLMMEGTARLGTYNSSLAAVTPVTPGEVISLELSLGHISLALNAGHQLRVSVSSSSSPKLWVNPNDGSSYGQAQSPVPCNVTLLHGPAGCRLSVPVMA
eukprot:TRINITY_DN7784_c0_g2_i1.p1 TRINITY_DN7784_c0_g2~~TRINITY_DN7784_c0_g2_i1.p1  ORF type:complete len:333 (-),score=40.67 TRINITY_DN7784_c0_g2_i1:393-1391(-)